MKEILILVLLNSFYNWLSFVNKIDNQLTNKQLGLLLQKNVQNAIYLTPQKR